MDCLSRFWLIRSKLFLNKISFVSVAVLSCNKPFYGPTSTEIYFILCKNLLAPIKIAGSTPPASIQNNLINLICFELITSSNLSTFIVSILNE